MRWRACVWYESRSPRGISGSRPTPLVLLRALRQLAGVPAWLQPSEVRWWAAEQDRRRRDRRQWSSGARAVLVSVCFGVSSGGAPAAWSSSSLRQSIAELSLRGRIWRVASEPEELTVRVLAPHIYCTLFYRTRSSVCTSACSLVQPRASTPATLCRPPQSRDCGAQSSASLQPPERHGGSIQQEEAMQRVGIV